MRALHRDYHEWCFKCVLCDTTLVLGKQLDHDGEPYCKSCYNKAHAPKGYISGGHGGALSSFQEEKIEKRMEELKEKGAQKAAEERAAKEAEEAAEKKRKEAEEALRKKEEEMRAKEEALRKKEEEMKRKEEEQARKVAEAEAAAKAAEEEAAAQKAAAEEAAAEEAAAKAAEEEAAAAAAAEPPAPAEPAAAPPAEEPATEPEAPVEEAVEALALDEGAAAAPGGAEAAAADEPAAGDPKREGWILKAPTSGKTGMFKKDKKRYFELDGKTCQIYEDSSKFDLLKTFTIAGAPQQGVAALTMTVPAVSDAHGDRTLELKFESESEYADWFASFATVAKM